MTDAFLYTCLDSGNRRKLERFGALVVDRPCPQATWAPGLPSEDWATAAAAFQRPPRGPSAWVFRSDEPPPGWAVEFDGMRLGLRPAAQGQVGVFPEQLENWRWLRRTVAAAGRSVAVLNGFAYTGAASLFAAAGGAAVCHVDAAKASVTQARRNAEASGLADRPIRWIVDDMVAFMQKEVRRGRRYDGIILDPPAFGRAPGGKTWSLERQLPLLLELAARLLSDQPCFCLFSCHAPEIGEVALGSMLRGLGLGPGVETGALALTATSGAHVPAGVFARWSRP